MTNQSIDSVGFLSTEQQALLEGWRTQWHLTRQAELESVLGRYDAAYRQINDSINKLGIAAIVEFISANGYSPTQEQLQYHGLKHLAIEPEYRKGLNGLAAKRDKEHCEAARKGCV